MGPYLDVEPVCAGSTAPGLGKVDPSAHGVDRKSNAEAINTLLRATCDGLPITDAQLRAELEEGGDLKDVQCGALTPKALRLTAETLALMRYARIPAQATEAGNSRVPREVTRCLRATKGDA
jgi:hypothetical protein